MTLPVVLRSDMLGAPSLTIAANSINNLLNACLVNGFNTQPVVSATASGGVVTFNFSTDPRFSARDTVQIAGASNSTVNGKFRVQSAASNQVLVPIPGVPDGAVGGTITLKFAPLGWTRPYSGTNLAAFRQGGSATHKRFLRILNQAPDVSTPTNSRFYARGYENMTSINAGTGPFPTTAQISGNGTEQLSTYTGDSYPTAPRHWIIFGTPRFFVMYHGYQMDQSPWEGGPTDTVTPIITYSRRQAGMFYFGELANIFKPADTYACVIPKDYNCYTAWITRAYTAASGAVEAYAASMGSNGNLQPNLGGGQAVWPNPADGGTHFFPSPIVYDYLNSTVNLRGTFPGMLQPMENVFDAYTTFEPPVGWILENVPGVTGRVMLTGQSQAGQQSLGWAIDEDWGDT